MAQSSNKIVQVGVWVLFSSLPAKCPLFILCCFKYTNCFSNWSFCLNTYASVCVCVCVCVCICICYLLSFFWDVCLVNRLTPQQGPAKIVGQAQIPNPQQKWPQPKSTKSSYTSNVGCVGSIGYAYMFHALQKIGLSLIL